MAIIFQSKYGNSYQTGTTKSQFHFSGDDWSDIRKYTLGDDSREIIWKKSTIKDIVAKKRETHHQVQLIFWKEENFGDKFHEEHTTISRDTWKQKSISILEHSAYQGGYQYKTLHGFFEGKNTLEHEETKKKLIIFLSNQYDSDILQSLGGLASVNDFIYIHPLHPWEISPNNTFLIEGKLFHQKKLQAYKKDFEAYQNTISSTLQNIGITPLFPSTDVHIDTILTHFFRYRYAAKR